MPDDLAVSTVLRCVDTQARRRLEMVMDDKMDYRSLKDKLILLDKNTRAWSGDNFLKNFQQAQALQGQPSSSSNSNYQGPQPMEVDNAHFGNKGKGKKGKGTGKQWSFPFGGGKYGSKGRGNKGKSKGKGKKGKGKNKGKSKGKGRDYCRICNQYGHWGNECPMKNGVNNVASSENATTANLETASSVPSSAGAAARRNSGQSTSSTTSTKATNGNIRMVKMYHVATPPEEYPEQFELQSENGSESWWSARVVTMRMDDEEEDDWGKAWQDDNLYKWYSNDFDMEPLEEENVDRYHIRAIQTDTKQLIVLDSGADISLLPYHMWKKGKPTKMLKAVLEDAQGEKVQTFGRRLAQIECDVGDGVVIIEDDFIVASVQSPLISMGRL